MKNKQNLFSNLKLYKDIYEAGSLVSLSNEKHLKSVLKEIGMRFVYLSFLRTEDINRIRSLHNFAMYLIKLRRHHGDMYVIKFLKASQLAIQKKIAGSSFSSLREIEPDLPLPRLTRSGLPLIIKLSDRAAIVRGSLTVIRYWLSLLGLYRVLKGEIKSKLNTITDPFSGDLNVLNDFQKFLWLNSKRLLTSFSPHFDLTKLQARRIINIQKASPSSSVSWLGLFHDIQNLDVYLRDSVLSYLDLTNSTRLRMLYDDVIGQDLGTPSTLKSGRHLGQLSFKEEAAGKLRVFAMVDVFTQSLLKPLHDYLFDIFKKLPNDGTHDQGKAFDLATQLAIKYNGSFGFDLSSATDRLPVVVQEKFLSVIFGKGFGTVWRRLLVNRPYFISNNKYNIDSGNVYYSVGQPMGALSSWAMLNMIHHLMVQYCYSLNYGFNKPWYRDYVVLGDDLVLFDPKVAEKYLTLCKGLGVEINLTKSVIAKGVPVVEFAKRTSYKGFDVSALSFKEFISNNNFFGRLSITSKLISRGWGKSNKKIFIFGNAANKFKVRLSYPIIGYLSQLVNKGLLPFERLLSLLLDSNKPLSYFGHKIQSFDKENAKRMFFSLLKDSNSILTSNMSNLWFASKKSVSYKVYLIDEIVKLKTKLNNLDLIEDNMNRISKKFDLENTQFGRYYLEGIMEDYQLSLILFENKCRWFSFPNFINTPSFDRLTIEDLLQILNSGRELLIKVSFDKEKVERRKKIDNDIKILEFIRNSNTSKVSQKVSSANKMAFPTNMFPMFLLNKTKSVNT
jgi:hypothetical protein